MSVTYLFHLQKTAKNHSSSMYFNYRDRDKDSCPSSLTLCGTDIFSILSLLVYFKYSLDRDNFSILSLSLYKKYSLDRDNFSTLSLSRTHLYILRIYIRFTFSHGQGVKKCGGHEVPPHDFFPYP